MSDAPKRKAARVKILKKKAARRRSDSFRDVVAGPTAKQIDESLAQGKILKLEEFKKGVKL
jgi:hypothetical protein